MEDLVNLTRSEKISRKVDKQNTDNRLKNSDEVFLNKDEILFLNLLSVFQFIHFSNYFFTHTHTHTYIYIYIYGKHGEKVNGN